MVQFRYVGQWQAMNWDTLLALTGFVAVMIGTPGPANASAMASGAAVGFIRSLPFLVGIWVGFVVVIFAVAGGLGGLLIASSAVHGALKIIGFGYICYLAWKIWQMPDQNAERVTTRQFGFRDGLFLHPLNPKAYVMLMVVLSSFVSPEQNYLWQTSIIVLVTLFTGVPLNSLWCVSGGVLHRFMQDPGLRPFISSALSFSMIASVAWAMFV